MSLNWLYGFYFPVTILIIKSLLSFSLIAGFSLLFTLIWNYIVFHNFSFEFINSINTSIYYLSVFTVHPSISISSLSTFRTILSISIPFLFILINLIISFLSTFTSLVSLLNYFVFLFLNLTFIYLIFIPIILFYSLVH